MSPRASNRSTSSALLFVLVAAGAFAGCDAPPGRASGGAEPGEGGGADGGGADGGGGAEHGKGGRGPVGAAGGPSSGGGGHGGGKGDGGGGAAPCGPFDCSFTTSGGVTQVTCDPREPILDLLPGRYADARAVQVAATDQEVVLATGNRCEAKFFRVVGDGSEPGEVVVAGDATRLSLATRPQQWPGSSIAWLGITGDVLVAGHVYVDNLGGLSAGPSGPVVGLGAGKGEYWHELGVFAPPDGSLHAACDQRHFVRSDFSASWTEKAPHSFLGWGEVPTLDAAGRLVSFFEMADPNGGARVVMRRGSGSFSVGDPGVRWFRPVGPPSEFLSASAPTTAVVLQYEDRFEVVWPTAEGEGRSTIVAPMLRRDCTDDEGLYFDGSCEEGEACEERGSGVGIGAFATARTADGDVWVAYVASALDVTVRFRPDSQFSCVAQRELVTDASTASFHLVRVPLDGSPPVEVLAEPCPEPGADYAGLTPVVMHAFESRLAVARVSFDPAYALRADVVSFDTASFEGP